MPNASRIPFTAIAGLAALLAGAGALAQQQTVAGLKQVTGNVLVSREAGLATGNEAQRLVNGTRIITTANSTAVVVFDNGCEVRLEENERLEIDSDKPCAAMLVQGLGPAPLLAGAPAMGTVVPLLIGTGIILDLLDKGPVATAVSPN